MKIFVDENIPLITVEELRSKGFDVADIRGSSEQGMPDEQLWLKVQEEKRLLITTDKGFSNYRNEGHHGILIVRLRQPTPAKNPSARHAGHHKVSRRTVARVDGGNAG